MAGNARESALFRYQLDKIHIKFSQNLKMKRDHKGRTTDATFPVSEWEAQGLQSGTQKLKLKHKKSNQNTHRFPTFQTLD